MATERILLSEFFHKSKLEFLRNRFGKHRKPADLSSPASHLGISSRVNGIEEADENEKEAARKAMREEQDRLQEKYRVHSTGRHNESYQVRSGLLRL